MHSNIKVVKSFTVCEDEKYYYAHPSITRTANGDILVGFRQSICRYPESFTHIDPTARTVLMRSSDEGKSWSQPVLLDIELPPCGTLGDPMFTTLEDGRILVGLFCWRVYEKGQQEPDGKPTIDVLKHPDKWHTTIDPAFFAISDDNGYTWHKSEGLGTCGSAMRSDVIESADGKLLSPVYMLTDDNGNFGSNAGTHLYVSEDRGETWCSYGEFLPNQDCYGFNETFIYKTPGNKLVAFARAGTGVGSEVPKGFDVSQIRCLFVSYSSDFGKSWSPVKKYSDILSYPFHAHPLPSGKVLLSYGRRKEPFSIRALILNPECDNISDAQELILADNLNNNDLGYTSAINLGDGRVLIVYYTNTGKSACIKAIILEECN